MTFLDEAEVEFVSGRGGSGAVSFHREKFLPNGGPDGADGGRGGDVVLLADRHNRTLYDFKLRRLFEAQSGSHGVTHKRGKDGKSIEIKLPVGTVVLDGASGKELIDLKHHGMRFVVAVGGQGGKGNLHFANSVRQAPNFAQKGGPPERVRARLELKLLADVGLVGLPNAGKSTLVSQLSAARPKIADYPFTTVVPNLGVASFRGTSFVVADMPGLIRGASEGVGLGHQFLRHVERNRVLVHVVDSLPVDESDPVENYLLIEDELRRYSEAVWSRPRVIALNKIDLLSSEAVQALVARFEPFERPTFPISAAAGLGLDPMLHAVVDLLEAEQPEAETPVLRPMPRPSADDWNVAPEGEGYRLTGARLERMVVMTDLENDEALRYLQRRLERVGVFRRLRELGLKVGDSVRVGEVEFEYEDQE